jgi:signal transduction histidine kinase/ActR/RegA family two-component response regulator
LAGDEVIKNGGSSFRHEGRARLLRKVLLTLTLLSLAYLAISLVPGFSANPLLGVVTVCGLLIVLVACLLLLHRGRLVLATQIFLLVLFATGVAAVVGYGGVFSSNWVIFPALLICAGMLSGWRAVLIYGGLSSLVLVGLVVDHWLGLVGLPIHPQQALPSVLVVLFCLLMGAVFMANALRLIEEAHRDREAFERQRMEASRLEAVGQLAGGLAHDFNNLMMAVTGNASLLARQPGLDPDAVEQIDQIRQVGKRMTELTRQLLAFARRQVLEPRLLALNDVVSGIEELTRRLIREDIHLEVHLAPDLPVVRADPAQLEQVLLNLTINARDAMPDGGRLTIETGVVDLDADYCSNHAGTTPGRHVSLMVSDTGIGMSAETQDRIFEPFYSTKQGRGGTGLGLATVWGIVRQSGGHLHVYSEPGRGSTFKVYLPAVSGRPEPAVAATVGKPEPSGRGELVLVVDDELMVREINGRMLEHCGYKTLLAADGQQALDLARKQTEPIALLITDVVMPGLGGRALAASLQAEQPDLRVLYVSGYTENAIVHQGELEPGVHFLSKPYNTERLAHKVREVLDSRPARE